MIVKQGKSEPLCFSANVNAEFNGSMRLLRRAIRRIDFAYRLAAWFILLMLSPLGFELLVRRVPQSWLQSAGMTKASAWLGMLLFVFVIPAVTAAVRYTTARSERANVVTPELVHLAEARSDGLAVEQLRSASATLRAASESRWCEPSVRRDAALAADRIETLLETRCGFPIPSAPGARGTEHLPLPV